MPGDTSSDSSRTLLHRHAGNPILSAAHWPYDVNAVFNAGAARLADGQTILLCRVESRSGRSHFCAARSDDGIGAWRIDEAPTMRPQDGEKSDEAWGIEDPRIVYLEELKHYAVTYTGFSRRGPAVRLALTQDFVTFDRPRTVLPPENKDAALLPRRIDGRWAMIHRPAPIMGRPSIWISFSPDLIHWGDHGPILEPRDGPWWDSVRVGLGPPVTETDRGWLMLYHGVKRTVSGLIYRLGAALLDLEDPKRCLGRSHESIFSPDHPLERVGDVPNVAFPCGATIADDGDGLNLYYGAADTSIGLATGSIRQILSWLERHRRGERAPPAAEEAE